MIRNGDVIKGYTVLVVANGIALAESKTAPDPYVVWRIDADCHGVYSGSYMQNRESAEWDFCAKAFPWFEDNAPINMIEDDEEERISEFNGYLCAAEKAIKAAAAAVETMVAEHSRLEKEAPLEEGEEQKVPFCGLRRMRMKVEMVTATPITINGIDWVVNFVDKTHEVLTDDDGEQDAYGITVFRECEIYIDRDLPEGLMRQIITHELVHAVAFSYGIDLERANEEAFCEFTAAHFDEIKKLKKSILRSA